MSEKEPLLRVERLYRSFRSAGLLAPGSSVRAVDDVSLCIGRGETYGLVGESGCGKSTLGRCILRLIEPDAGQVFFEGEDFLKLRGRRVRSLRRRMQMVFQDPYLSLDPKMRIGSALMEALAIHGMGSRKERFDRAMTLLLRMGFSPEHFFRFPHEFSGGQRQRIGLARALILEPSLIVCDEPVSALDVSVQAQIINLMKDIQEERGVSYLFIAHNLSVVRYISHRVGVMYLGSLAEEAETEELFRKPAHPYTQALLASALEPDPRRIMEHTALQGEVPSPVRHDGQEEVRGCAFALRCPHAREKCRCSRPELAPVGHGAGHRAACFYPLQTPEA